jgi:hypothetical protein
MHRLEVEMNSSLRILPLSYSQVTDGDVDNDDYDIAQLKTVTWQHFKLKCAGFTES